jgi:hypothetical protein
VYNSLQCLHLFLILSSDRIKSMTDAPCCSKRLLAVARPAVATCAGLRLA